MLQSRLQNARIYWHQMRQKQKVQDIIAAHQYDASAGRHDIDVYIYEYPKTGIEYFWCLVR